MKDTVGDTVSEAKTSGERLSELSPLQKAALGLRELRARLDKVEGAQREPIAIVGMACRFPQADGLEAYWRLLSEGIDAIGEVPAERWDLERFFDSNPNAPGKITTRYGGFIDSVDGFDASFFGISPREAERLDPQQRLLLEVAWHALEDAGQAPSGLRGTRAGVFVGITQIDYGVMQLGGPAEDIQAYTGTGNGQAFAAGRLAYVLGVHGPTFSVDTACSSSMVALHQACTALRNGECELALVAGVQLNLTPPMQVFLSKTQSFSPDGRCRTFDESANGFVLGEGVGVIVLRRQSDALARGDQIRALIRASGINHDGPASGLTVPSESAQEALLRAVHDKGRLAAADIDYVEAHGTATQMGDPIEVGALRAVFGERAPDQALLLGSVKTNFGHLSAASGIAGLIKVTLMLEHGQVAPNLHFNQPSTRVPWDGFTVRVPTALEAWPDRQRPRLAGVSSFGLSGTNTHTVLEQAPAPKAAAAAVTADRPLHLLALSARSEKALRDLAAAYLASAALQDGADGDAALADLCFSANTGRSHFNWRLALPAGSLQQVRDGLSACDASRMAQVPKGGFKPVALLFAADAPVAAVRALALSQPRVAATLARCAAAYQIAVPGADLFGDARAAVFASQFALAALWRDWGVTPGAVAGDGIGALTALTVAGAFDLEQAFAVLAGRSVDGGVPQLAVYGADGAPLPFAPLPGYRLAAPAGTTDLAVPALVAAGYGNLLVTGGTDPASSSVVGVTVLGLPADAADLWPALLAILAQLYLRGLDVRWERYDADYGRARLRLPGYRFQRQRFWLEPSKPAVTAAPVAAPPAPVALSLVPPVAAVSAAMPAPAPVAARLVAAQPAASATVSTLRQPAPQGAHGHDLSRLLGNQLEVAAASINDVVAQQLQFLKRRMGAGVTAAPTAPALQAVAPVVAQAVVAPVVVAGPDTAPQAPVQGAPGVAAAMVTEVVADSAADIVADSVDKTGPAPLLGALGDWRLLLMAADSAERREQLAATLAAATEGQALDGIVGGGAQRAMLVHRGHDDAVAALGGDGARDMKRVILGQARSARSVVFMFPGVGDQYLRMAQGLYASEPVFRRSVERCCDYLKTALGLDLLGVLYPAQAAVPAAASAPSAKPDLRAMLARAKAGADAPVDPAEAALNQTVHSQPLMFIVEYALGQMWLARGLVPQAMIGYSVGEYAAACLAGVIALEDALTLIARRARMIAALPHGVMLAVPLAQERVLPMLGDALSLCIVSTPGLCVVGGPEAAVAQLEQRLKADEVVSRRLPGTHAYHSRMLAPLHDALVDLVGGFTLKPPAIPYLSNLTGNWISDAEACDPAYWARHSWQTVRFADGLARLLDTEGRIFLELGPGQSLGSFVLQHPAALQLRDKIALPSLKSRYEQQADEAFLLGTLGKLWLAGVNF